MNFEEFSTFIKKVLSSRSEALLDKVFDEFDVDKSGVVSLQEIKHGLTTNKFIRNFVKDTPLRSMILPESMKSAIEMLDANGDGSITRDELSYFLEIANSRSDHEFLVKYKGKTVVCGNRAEKDKLMHLEKVAQEEKMKKANDDKKISTFQKGSRYIVPKSEINIKLYIINTVRNIQQNNNIIRWKILFLKIHRCSTLLLLLLSTLYYSNYNE